MDNKSGGQIKIGGTMLILDAMKNIKKVEELNCNTPNGRIKDADTILVDLIDNADFEVTGLAQEIFNIYKESVDKESVEKMFFLFTWIGFDEYLIKCEQEISKEINGTIKPFC